MRILLMLASLSLLSTQNNTSAKLVRVGGEFRVKSIQKTKDRGFVITFASTDSKAQVQEIILESTYLHVSVEEGKVLRLSAEVAAQQGRVVTARQILLFLPTAGSYLPVWLLSRFAPALSDLKGARYIDMHAPQSDFMLF